MILKFEDSNLDYQSSVTSELRKSYNVKHEYDPNFIRREKNNIFKFKWVITYGVLFILYKFTLFLYFSVINIIFHNKRQLIL